MKEVIILFYGLIRTLDKSLENLKKNIFYNTKDYKYNYIINTQNTSEINDNNEEFIKKIKDIFKGHPDMDVSKLEAAITPKTKAIVPVHYTGYMTDMRKLLPIANKYNLPVIESTGEKACCKFSPLAITDLELA